MTRLRCGGFILASRFNHTMCDGFGMFLFMNTLAEMAQGAQQPSIPPMWQREFLSAPNPLRMTCPHHEFQQAMTNNNQVDSDETKLVQRSFFFGVNQIRAIQKLVPPPRLWLPIRVTNSLSVEISNTCTRSRPK